MRKRDELFVKYFQAADGRVTEALEAVKKDIKALHIPNDGKELVQLLYVQVKLNALIADPLDYKRLYDGIMCLEHDLEQQHHDAEVGCLDYKVIKTLAACYELQDYLANRIAMEPPSEEPDCMEQWEQG